MLNWRLQVHRVPGLAPQRRGCEEDAALVGVLTVAEGGEPGAGRHVQLLGLAAFVQETSLFVARNGCWTNENNNTTHEHDKRNKRNKTKSKKTLKKLKTKTI